jgi:hypothetical protein
MIRFLEFNQILEQVSEVLFDAWFYTSNRPLREQLFRFGKSGIDLTLTIERMENSSLIADFDSRVPSPNITMLSPEEKHAIKHYFFHD